MLPVTKPYKGAFEVHGNTAMFARPDSDADAASYPAPTYSAVKGMIEHICGHSAGARIVPTKVHICRPVRYDRFTYNGRFAAQRKGTLIKEGNAVQRRETILTDVAYQIFFEIVYIGDQYLRGAALRHAGTNHAHYLLEMFKRRIARGQPLRPVALGRSEHVPTYLGELLPETSPDPAVNIEIGRMMRHPFSQDDNYDGKSRYAPRFDDNVRVVNGVLSFEAEEAICA